MVFIEQPSPQIGLNSSSNWMLGGNKEYSKLKLDFYGEKQLSLIL